MLAEILAEQGGMRKRFRAFVVAYALAYADAGLRVIASKPGLRAPLDGLTPHEHGTRDADTIEAWWRDEPDANVSICTGEGVLGLDIDGRYWNTTVNWWTGGRVLPETLMSHSPRGWHAYYSLPGYWISGNDNWKHASEDTEHGALVTTAPRVKVRGEGGAMLEAPSLTVETGLVDIDSCLSYHWVSVPPLAPTPDWLLTDLIERRLVGLKT